MNRFFRRLRGIIGTAVTWAVGWAGLFTVAGVMMGAASIPGLALTGGFLGLVGGGAFAVILSIAERRRGLPRLSLWRTALWGGLGGALVAGSLNLLAGSGGLIWGFVGGMALFGAASSAGTVAVAKRASTQLPAGQGDHVAGIEGNTEQAAALGGSAQEGSNSHP